MRYSANYNAASGLIAPGIPARDLTADEWQALPAGVRAALVEQGVYSEVALDEGADSEAADEGGSEGENGSR